MACYSYKGQSTSSAKSLLSGAVMNYSSEKKCNARNPNLKLFNNNELKTNRSKNSLAQSVENRKTNASWIEDSYRIKRNIAVYKLN